MSDFSDFEFELHRIPFEILEDFLYKSVTFLGSRPVILIYPFIHSTHSIVSRYVVVGREKKRYVVVATAWHRLQYRKCRQVGRTGDQRADDSPGVRCRQGPRFSIRMIIGIFCSDHSLVIFCISPGSTVIVPKSETAMLSTSLLHPGTVL